MLEEFKKQYIEKCIHGDGFDNELNGLFEQVLIVVFKDDSEKMSAFIQSINDEVLPEELSEVELLKQENTKLQAAIKSMQDESEMVQNAFMEISDYVFSI
ncbi:hypothetical protein ACOYYK_04465 [Enterococcus gallinarum]|uniref:hypothetical protein n=1 Tax=Enterococcus gallinarum TaxID=1353 RepID=UPI003BD1FD6A